MFPHQEMPLPQGLRGPQVAGRRGPCRRVGGHRPALRELADGVASVPAGQRGLFTEDRVGFKQKRYLCLMF